jgi:hypothetical protein
MRGISTTAQNYLANASRVRIANLVRIVIAESVYIYLTDYGKSISFKGSNYISGRLKSISNLRQSKDLNTQTINLVVSGAVSEEVTRFLDNATSLLDNQVTIWQAYLDDNNNIIPWDPITGDPYIWFQGKISSGSISDSLNLSSSSSSITWVCSNDFYDFDQTAGRFTDDTSHRGLVVSGGSLVPSGAARRPEYQEDYGFFHANKSVAFLGKYQTQEQRHRLKSHRSGGFSGLMGGKNYDLETYWETVTREVDLSFNLSAKYLPVIYGVQKTSGIPIFADTELNNPNSVWVVYAVCEGEIEGFLDIIIDDKPMICYNDADDDDRICFGRKQINGDTMNVIAGGQSGTPAGRAPSTHGQEYIYDDGDGAIHIWTFHGLSNQTAAQVLVDKAASGGFFLQNDAAAGPEWWDSRYKLLDTAYIVVNFKLSSNRTNIPSIDVELSGRKIRQFTDINTSTSNKTSIILPFQILDYLTSNIFGPGIPLTNINIQSIVDCANLCKLQDTTYDYTWNKYWRYIGWDVWNNSYRYKMQTNVILDSSNTIFKNVQSLLNQGIMSLNLFNGQYYLTMERAETPVLHIDGGQLLDGSIQVSDTTGKSKFNSVQASLLDPANNWKSTAVTFFNSTYLAEDNYSEKKLGLTLDYVTNYYTARSIIERELKKSRYTREVSITLPFKYFGLLPNDPVTLSYDRYGFDTKDFLVSEIDYYANGRYSVTLQEYAPDVFINSNHVDNSSNQVPSIVNLILPPRDLTYVPEGILGVDKLGINGYLTWTASATTKVLYYTIYISGQIDPLVVYVVNGQTSYSLTLSNLPAGNYTFEVRAVDGNGFRSKAATLSVNINASFNLAKVSNFRVVNRTYDDPNQFSGGVINLTWDTNPEESIIPGIYYDLEIFNNVGTMIRNVTIQNQHSYSYTLAFMKADYLATTGSLGIYREYNFKIKARGPHGEESVAWAEIN